MNKTYEIITDRIIKKLESGVIPWARPWRVSKGWPKNLISDKKYKGINVFCLASEGFASPYWLTYKQAKEMGGNVLRGQHGTPVVFWKMLDKSDSMIDEKTKEELISPKYIPMARYYTVFNLEQCENIPEDKLPEKAIIPETPFNPIEECEQIINNMPQCPEIKHQQQRAYYSPQLDYINMPKEATSLI